MRRLAAPVLTASLILAASAALGAPMPPEMYAAARERAPDVIVVDVQSVTPPKVMPGRCAVKARVATIERGSRYKVGDRIKIPVRCRAAGDPAGPDSGVFQDLAALTAGKHGRAFLESGYPLLDQYDILPAS